MELLHNWIPLILNQYITNFDSALLPPNLHHHPARKKIVVVPIIHPVTTPNTHQSFWAVASGIRLVSPIPAWMETGGIEHH